MLMHSNSMTIIGDIYSNYKSWLAALLNRRTGCIDTAADLTQDVFVRLLNKPILPEILEPKAYLARIAHGLLIDHHRRASLEKSWLEQLQNIPEQYVPSAQDQAIMIETLASIDLMLNGLKPRVRKVFLMSRLEGISYTKIAALLQVSKSSVEKDMATALRHCYKLMIN